MRNTETETFGNRDFVTEYEEEYENLRRDTEKAIRGTESRRRTGSTKDGNMIVGNRVKKHEMDTLGSQRSISSSPIRNNLASRLKKSSKMESTGKVKRRLGFEDRQKQTPGVMTEPHMSASKKQSDSSLGTQRGTHKPKNYKKYKNTSSH